MTADRSDEFLAGVRSVEAGLSEIFTYFRAVIREHASRVHPEMMPGEYKLLSVIARRGPISAKALGEWLDLDKAQVSRGIRELEGFGLVERAPDPADRRSFAISMTPLGTERLDGARGAQEHTVSALVAEWETGDIVRLGELLRRLTDQFEPARKPDCDDRS